MGALHCRPVHSLALLTGDRQRLTPPNPSRQWTQTKGIDVVAPMGLYQKPSPLLAIAYCSQIKKGGLTLEGLLRSSVQPIDVYTLHLVHFVTDVASAMQENYFPVDPRPELTGVMPGEGTKKDLAHRGIFRYPIRQRSNFFLSQISLRHSDRGIQLCHYHNRLCRLVA